MSHAPAQPERDGHGAHGLTAGELGTTLRELRRRREESLAAVAAATSLSPSFLSLVESGRSDISFGRLLRILAHYEVGLSDILPPREHQLADVVRGAERPKVYFPGEGIEMELLTPDTNRTMMLVMVTYEPLAKTAEFTSHHGEEFVLVLEGRIEITRRGAGVVSLKEGDTVYFDSAVPHSLANPIDRPTVILGAITPPTW